MKITTIPWSTARRNAQPEPTIQRPVPTFTEENFPVLPKLAKADIHADTDAELLIPQHQTWADVASFDRFRRWNELAYEIKQQIIRYQMHMSGEFIKELDVLAWLDEYPDMSPSLPPFLPPICYTSKEMLSDAASVFIFEVEWKIRSIIANRFVCDFLSSLTAEVEGKIDEVGFKSLRKIHFSSFHRFRGIETMGQNLDLQLMKRCTGLKHLTLTFHVSIMVSDERPNPETGPVPLKNVEDLVRYYGMEEIFECRNLKTFKIDGIMKVGFRNDAKERMVDLANWVRDGFLKQWNQVVEVDVSWRQHSFRKRYWDFEDDTWHYY